MTAFHVDRSRWQAMTLFEQLGNVSSEVGRSLQARRSGNQSRLEAAIIRTLDLINATVEETLKDKPYRARELLRSKDQYLQLFFGDQQDSSDAVNLERYFARFAVAARIRR